MTTTAEILQIKPLDWKFFDVRGQFGSQGVWDANGINCTYTIEDVSNAFDGGKPFYCNRISEQFGTLEEAQAAAQVHHENGILCCIIGGHGSIKRAISAEEA